MYLILQHEPDEGPERLRLALPGPARTVRVFAGDPLPKRLVGIDGILTLGGEMNVHDALPWMPGELDLLRSAHAAQIPILGVCLGSQLLATALGGAVARMAAPEVGWWPVRRTRPDPLTEGLPDPMMQFHAHSYAVTRVPEGALVLLASDACPVQAWRVGDRTLGLQFHCEWEAETTQRFYRGATEMSAHYSDYEQLGSIIAARIAAGVFSRS